MRESGFIEAAYSSNAGMNPPERFNRSSLTTMGLNQEGRSEGWNISREMETKEVPFEELIASF
jgi:hypothetical protein